MSVYTTIFIGSTPIGNLLASSVAAAFGTSAAFLVTGLPCVLAAGVAAWLWQRERRSRSTSTAVVVDGAEVALASAAETRLSTGVVPEAPADASGIRSISPGANTRDAAT